MGTSPFSKMPCDFIQVDEMLVTDPVMGGGGWVWTYYLVIGHQRFYQEARPTWKTKKAAVQNAERFALGLRWPVVVPTQRKH